MFLHHGKKGVKWDINYIASEKTVLHEDVIGKV
jgi:hypothetical protein